jgi:hypothetical protein
MTDLTTLIRTARARGWEVTVTRGGHLRFRHPASGALVHSASTTSDRRGMRNLRADLRRGERAAPVRR